MPPKSKVEQSPHFNEIVDLLLEGWSSRKVSSYLKEQYDEDIGYNAVNTYRKNHLNVDAAVNNEMEKEKLKLAVEKETARKTKAQKHFEKAVQKGVSTRKLLQVIISDGPELWEQLLNDDTISLDVKVKLVLQASKQEQDWVKNDESNVEVNINNSLSSLFDDDLIEEVLHESETTENCDK